MWSGHLTAIPTNLCYFKFAGNSDGHSNIRSHRKLLATLHRMYTTILHRRSDFLGRDTRGCLSCRMHLTLGSWIIGSVQHWLLTIKYVLPSNPVNRLDTQKFYRLLRSGGDRVYESIGHTLNPSDIDLLLNQNLF